MLTALFIMTCIELFPKWDLTKEFWAKTVGSEVFWPWYTLIGALITLTVAWTLRGLIGEKAEDSRPLAP
jgi:ABC-type branched-subunit amino acid transport system permease subunit